MIYYFKSAIFLILLSCLQSKLDAQVEPSPLFGNHMVLQREMPIPVWGKSKAGEKVLVSFAGHQVTGVANKSGRWKIELPPLEASSVGREMRIEGKNLIIFKDVLVGEVWICSGQSNMQYGWGTESPFSRYNWGGDSELKSLVPKAIDMPIRSYHVEVDASLSPKDTCGGKWYQGPSASAVGFGFSYHLHQSLQVPIAVIVTCWGSSSIEGWMPLDMTKSLPHFKEEIENLFMLPSVSRINRAIETGVRDGFVWLRKRPNLLYNAMFHPIIPYACRGVVWYQGEANANRPSQYKKSLSLWIQRIRQGWGRDDLHFLAVMLPGYGADDGYPNKKSWAWFREAQMNANNLSHVNVVNTIDLGDAKNIHPSDKAPIASRLALLAREKIYGEKISSRGPMYKEHSIVGNKMILSFSVRNSLKTVDGENPRGFWLADEKGAWHEAKSAIEGKKVILYSDNIPDPKACRYAFSGKPDVNLVDGEGLPTYPFRTDNWEAPLKKD